MAIDNVLVQGVEKRNPDLIVSSVSASPTKTNSGADVTLRFTIRNTGVADATSENIIIYRHRTKTTDPKTGGTFIGTGMTSGALAADASVTKSTTVTAPSVSSDTVFHYYVCVNTAEDEDRTENNCAENPATITVTAPVSETPVTDDQDDQKTDDKTSDDVVVGGTRNKKQYPEKSYPKPPYRDCYLSPNRTHVMGGDAVVPQRIDEDKPFGCGILTLGGVETKSGIKGFVVSAHVATRDDSSKGFDGGVNSLFWHSLIRIRGTKFLGKVSAMSDYEILGDDESYLIGADAAFVAYPTPVTTDCSLTWKDRGESFCLDLNSDNNQIETVTPLTIRGKGKDVYTVIGSKQPEKGLDIWFTGSVSGVSEGDPATVSGRLLVSGVNTIFHYTHAVTVTSLIGGDSGSPVYTAPDENGNVYIVGIVAAGGTERAYFNTWDDVTKALDLKPIESLDR